MRDRADAPWQGWTSLVLIGITRIHTAKLKPAFRFNFCQTEANSKSHIRTAALRNQIGLKRPNSENIAGHHVKIRDGLRRHFNRYSQINIVECTAPSFENTELGVLVGRAAPPVSLMRKQRQQNDDRDCDAKQPKQNASTHDTLLLKWSRCENPVVPSTVA
jgi:hypothetical protein